MEYVGFNEWITEATQLPSWKSFLKPDKRLNTSLQGAEGFKMITGRLSNAYNGLDKLAKKLDDQNFINGLIHSNSDIIELLKEDSDFRDEILKDELFVKMATAISNTVAYTAQKLKPSNPKIGVQSKNRADNFAEQIGKDLQKVRKEGHTTVRSIADRFNELGIKSARGNDWTHGTVFQLIKRRKTLGLESNEKNDGLDVS